MSARNEPGSFEEALDRLADHLDATDRISRSWAATVGADFDTDDRAQQALRRLAQWVKGNPHASVAELNDYFVAQTRLIADDLDRTVPIDNARLK